MPHSDPRFTIHPPSVQGLEGSYVNPKKRLSHTVKSTPSGHSPGVVVPIKRRIGIAVGIFGKVRG